MDIIIFIFKYTPFWSIPIGLICLEFAYIYWLKAFFGIAHKLIALGVFCFISLLYYMITGGPSGVTDNMVEVRDGVKHEIQNTKLD